MTAQIIALGMVFVLKMVFGYVLGHAGKPYSTVLLTVHKLLALAAGILMVIIAVGFLKKMQADVWKWVAIVSAAVFFLAAFATGALQSALKDTVPVVLLVHKIAPILALVSAGAAVFLFMK